MKRAITLLVIICAVKARYLQLIEANTTAELKNQTEPVSSNQTVIDLEITNNTSELNISEPLNTTNVPTEIVDNSNATVPLINTTTVAEKANTTNTTVPQNTTNVETENLAEPIIEEELQFYVNKTTGETMKGVYAPESQ